MAREKEVLEALTNLTAAGLRGAAGEAVWRDVIASYFCGKPGEDIAADDAISDSESESDLDSDYDTDDDDDAQDDVEMEELPDMAEMERIEEEIGMAMGMDGEDETVNIEKVAYDEWNGCKCSRRCKEQLSPEVVLNYRLDMLELTRDQKDFLVMGQVNATRVTKETSPVTNCTRRARQKERENAKSSYNFRGTPICVNMFTFMHRISNNKLTNLKRWIQENGMVPMRLKSGGIRRGHRVLSPEDVIRAVRFISNYAEDFAVFLPGRVPGFKRTDLRLLPTSATKASVFRMYEAAMNEQGDRVMALSTFRQLWKQYLPRIVTCKPMTDLCWKCQQANTRIYRTANQSEEQKMFELEQHEEHLRNVLLEREKYREEVAAARQSIADKAADLGPHEPCSREGMMHYSFDFAQQVHFPANPQQPGPIYFLTARKCGIFGINCEGIPKQVNFLVDEGLGHSKGSVAVISYVHFFFRRFGLGEQHASLHCDNCSGQNKNRYVIWYLLWRCLHGLHNSITLNFMVAGHTKFSPDYCFGLLKRKYQASEVSTLEDIATVVQSSSTSGVNVPQLVGNESGVQQVPTYPWQEFLSPYFKILPDIKKYHHFRFTSDEPGVVYCRQFADTDESRHSLLKPGARPPGILPPSLPAVGLSFERQQYLYEKIRPFCRPDARDITCPPPVRDDDVQR